MPDFVYASTTLSDKEVVLKTIALLESFGMVDGIRENDGRMCILGALNKAQGFDPFAHDNFDLVTRLHKELSIGAPALKREVDPAWELAEWSNDSVRVGRPQDVINALKTVAERLP